MNTRRFVLHLIVGLLTFLIGVTAAIALGGFNPLERFNRSYNRQYAMPLQTLTEPSTMTERNYGCPHAHRRTADLRYDVDHAEPPAPVAPVAPLDEPDAPPPPPKAPRQKY